MFKLYAPVLVALATIAVPSYGQQIFFQGFEVDNSGWNVLGGTNDATRVPSGTGGIPSSSGNFHALAAGPIQGDTNPNGSAFTRWGGYGFTPGCSGSACAAAFPASGYVTKLDIFLNVGGGFANDTRFDWDSAINQPSGAFRRDFVFNAGFYNDAVAPGSGPRFVISASNNANRSGAFPKNPGRDPFVITTTGWYTFVHSFRNNGGVLAVDLSILNAAGSLLHTWTLSDPTDLINVTVGGNRYGWFPSQEFASLAIDNSSLTIGGGGSFKLRYFTNLNIGDSFIDISNDGSIITTAAVGGSTPNFNTGNICVNAYTFDPAEEMVSCCACLLTPNALRSLSVLSDLISNTLTPASPTSVTVKLLGTAPIISGTNPITATQGCDATLTNGLTPGFAPLAGALQAWGTTLHSRPGGTSTTETPFATAALGIASGTGLISAQSELNRLATTCGFIQTVGSGFGICKSCRSGGLGAVRE